MRSRLAGTILCFVCAVVGGAPRAAPVARAGDLYASSTIVTGVDDRMRNVGLARCLRQVLVKVTGDPDLAQDPRVADEEAAAMVEDFVYLDRMSDVPTHDEQGTRDRPFDLTVHFQPSKIDALLAELGVPVWREPRPVLLLLATFTRNGETAPLLADGLPDTRLREAAEAAAERFGLRLALPAAADVPAGSTLDSVTLPALPNAIALHGALVWAPEAFGWIARWRIDRLGDYSRSPNRQWEIAGVSFDEAFRNAVGNAARTVAGR